MGNWRKKAKKLTQGKWIRFDESNPKWIVTFVGEPTVVEKTAQSGPNAGEKYEVMSFPIEVDGEDKILEPNRSLLLVMSDEDEDDEIIGKTFMIKCLDLKNKRSWKMVEQDAPISARKKKEESPEEEEVEEEEEDREKSKATEDKEKKKFKAEVAKRTAARKKKAKDKTGEGENVSQDEETGGESGEETTIME
jgi:hypothetical protein